MFLGDDPLLWFLSLLCPFEECCGVLTLLSESRVGLDAHKVVTQS